MSSPSPVSARPLRVVLCGYGHLGLALLQGLLLSPGCEVAGVFRWSARPNMQSYWEPVEDQFLQMVQHYGLRDIHCPGMNGYEFTELLNEIQPDVLLVGSWGEILKPHLLERPGMLCVNCHPSLLPAHRGANPYTSVIRAGETHTGVSFHMMARRIDAGDLLLQQVVAIEPEETGASLRDKCALIACQMVPDLVHRLGGHLITGAPLERIPQDESRQSYFPSIKPEDGLIDWAAGPDAFWRQFRSLYPWVVCHAVAGRRIVLFIDPIVLPNPYGSPAAEAGTILANRGGVLEIATADPGRLIRVNTYQIESARGYFPVWLSRLLGVFWLRPGVRLANKS